MYHASDGSHYNTDAERISMDQSQLGPLLIIDGYLQPEGKTHFRNGEENVEWNRHGNRYLFTYIRVLEYWDEIDMTALM